MTTTESMEETVRRVIEGFGDGSARHNFLGDHEDPFAVKPFIDGCVEFNNELFKWEVLERKAKGKAATEEDKKKYIAATRAIYKRIVHSQSIGMLILEKEQKFTEIMKLMEQRIAQLKEDNERYEKENKFLAKRVKFLEGQKSNSGDQAEEDQESSQLPPNTQAPKPDFQGFA